MKKIILALCMALAACGGDGSSSPVVQSKFAIGPAFNPINGTGSQYYPEIPGTQISYNTLPMNATWNSQTNILTVNSTSASIGYNTSQYSSTYCSDFGQTPIFLYTDVNGLPTSQQTPNPMAGLQDTIFISDNGIEYIGEVFHPNIQEGVANEVNPGEAKISMNPVPGEIIEGYSVVTKACGDPTVLNPSFHWSYTTVEILTEWNGFKNVVHSRLTEFGSGDSISAIYDYYYAEGIGMVAIALYEPGVSESYIPAGDNGIYYVPSTWNSATP